MQWARSIILFVSLTLTSQSLIGAEIADFNSLESLYIAEIQPLITRHCQKCHSDKVIEAEVDLSIFRSMDEIRQHSTTWQKVGEMLDTGQMPPKDAPQPSAVEHAKMREWVRTYLRVEAQSRAGDPGPVVLRRLNNVEYTNTIQDLTGVRSLLPAADFPGDNAAGEGFTNLGNALVMSPALVTKYLDAGKSIADHLVLLPTGFRFFPSVNRPDWTDELLAEIRRFYARYTDERGGTRVNLQGVVFDTNNGGRLPLEQYLAALLNARNQLESGQTTVEIIGRERRLSPKYLQLLWNAIHSDEPSILLRDLRSRWQSLSPSDAVALAEEASHWQQAMWTFSSVGHIGKVGGPQAWMEPVDPLTTRSDIRLKLAASSENHQIVVKMQADDAGDGNDNDFVVWEQPRLVAAGRPDLLLRDAHDFIRLLSERRIQTIATVIPCLNAVAEANVAQAKPSAAELSNRHKIDPEILTAWMEYLGIATDQSVTIKNNFERKINSVSGYDFVNGWGSESTPSILANSSDRHVRIPGNIRPHSVAVHPSNTLHAAVGWKSPLAATLRIEAKVQRGHPECGSGVTWFLELRRGTTRRRLATGIAAGAKEVVVEPIQALKVLPGDVISLLIGPRNGDHACGLTLVDLVLTSLEDSSRRWDLAADVSSNIQSANPHADRYGNEGIWNFYAESVADTELLGVIPAGSVLSKWLSAETDEERQQLAEALKQLLTGERSHEKGSPDDQLYHQLTPLSGPLFRSFRLSPKSKIEARSTEAHSRDTIWGVDPLQFGHHPNGQVIDSASLCVQAPSVIQVRLPAELVNGWDFVVSGSLHRETGIEGSVSLRVQPAKVSADAHVAANPSSDNNSNLNQTESLKNNLHPTAILVSENSAASRRIKAAFQHDRDLFPAALCYTRIVPVDEVVTLTLFHREDHHFQRLMLDATEISTLNRLWNELHFVSQDAFRLVDGFNQLLEFASQDGDPKSFEPLRKPIHDRAETLRKELLDAEPKQIDQIIEFAALAYRRPLSNAETSDLRGLYRKLREQELTHDEAIRFTLARILIAPAFLYRIEPTVTEQSLSNPNIEFSVSPVTDWAMASRLSYFLWSTMPDVELRTFAAQKKLHDPEVLVSQMKRMLKDDRIRSLATEFGCQWLGIHNFRSHSEKSEQVFPSFNALRSDMYEESIQFFTDLFQRDGSLLELLNADHTFLNESLAKHYEIPGVIGPEWRRVDNVAQYGRGGILTQATTLAQQSGASRTSPILRGNWVLETLLGEKLPRPPKNVPQLPESETDSDLTIRQLVEKHRSIESCAHCHDRIDAFGFSLERYDAIGRRREKDLAGREIDVSVALNDGTRFSSESGLRNYLLESRRNTFLRHFCRKLLGYSLARSVQLSDELLLDEMMTGLAENHFRFSVAVEIIVRSQQFRYQRGNTTN